MEPGILSKKSEIPDCAVCMEPLRENLTTMNCGHVFHFEWYFLDILILYYSISTALKNMKRCPLCRTGSRKLIHLIYNVETSKKSESELLNETQEKVLLIQKYNRKMKQKFPSKDKKELALKKSSKTKIVKFKFLKKEMNH